MHLKEEGCIALHHSHLYKYIAATGTCGTSEEVERMEEDLKNLLLTAALERKSQYLDYDGEHFLEISPAGYISVCIRWKTYIQTK